MSLLRITTFALLGAALALCPCTAGAQSSVAMLEIEGDFALPVTTPAFERFLPGGGGSLGVLFAPYRFVLPSIRARGIVLGDRAGAPDSRFTDPGIGALYTLTAGLRLRTDGLSQAQPEPEATGFWAEINLGVGLTGALVRPAFEASLGFLWDAGATDGAGHVDLGPVVRFIDVLQTDDSGIDPNSTYLVTLGLQIVLFDAAPVASVAQRVIQTRVAPTHRELEGADADGDGIDDADDGCRNEPEDLDGVRDLDGCPDLDDDGDGIPDTADQCPRDAEDPDGFQDDDGCPEIDNDGDSYPDSADACPNEAETENGVDDLDGCPEPGETPPAASEPVIDSPAPSETPPAETQPVETPLAHPGATP